MVNNEGICLYREARLNIEPAYPGSTIAFTLPSTPLTTFGSRPEAKRTVFLEQAVDQDEDAFTRRHLATDGSIFFRRHHNYPRSFLWRVLDSRKVLEIQAIDLEHEFSDRYEANITLLLQFPSPIRPFCVAFAETQERDVLVVYAITTSNELYTLNIPRVFFGAAVASEQDIEQWCQRAEPILFSGRIPYRLVVVEVDELLVTLDDGAICRLNWDKSNNSWEGARYSQNNWSVRGLLSWKAQPTVRYENADFSISAAAAVALSPDTQHIWSVSLDHTLRAWNRASGKPGVQTDLLGLEDRALEKSQSTYSISPTQSMLMAVSTVVGGIGGAAYHIVTYSPKLHHFKFWGIRDPDDHQMGIYDTAVGAELVPPIDELMNTTVWTLEEFHVIPGPTGWTKSAIWIRARSGPSSRVYKLDFDLTDDAETLSQCWKNDWISVDPGSVTVDSLKSNAVNPANHESHGESDVTDLTGKWLDFLFYPGRFTIPTLETALAILKRRLGRAQPSRSTNRASLKERICVAVASLASQNEDNPQSPTLPSNTIASQWQAYYGVVKDLHKRRGDSLRFVYDSKTNEPWLVLSDYVSAIRTCSKLELTTLNPMTHTLSRRISRPARKSLDNAEFREVSQLFNAAASFRKRLPLTVQHEIERHLEMDMLQSRSMTIIDRMEWVEGNSELLQHVSDDDLSQLIEELGMEVKDLSTDTFLGAIRTLGYQVEGKPILRRQLAQYGLSALLRVSQETVDAVHSCLLDLLALVLFMFVELEGETPDHFDPSEVFAELINQYKDCMVVSWLASRVWSHQSSTGPCAESVGRELSEQLKLGKTLPFTQTVLEGTFAQTACDALPQSAQADKLTQWSRGWIASIFAESSYDNVVEDAMGILIFQKEYGLATEFSKFLSESNWASYLKGRLHLVKGEFALASLCFQKPAYNFGMGAMFDVESVDTVGLVNEAEGALFSSGLSFYYIHIVGLFEKARAFSYVVDLARLGLRSISGGEDEDNKTDLLQYLFTAAAHTSRFQEAYSAMSRLRDPALQRSNLQTLITTMIAQYATSTLLNFPFVTLAEEVDAILYSLAAKTLNLASSPPYHQILFAWRLQRSNFRGAATIMFERLQRLKSTSSKHHNDDSLIHCYSLIINTLENVRKEDAYILAEQKVDAAAGAGWGIGQGKKALRRQIVTLETLRKELAAEMDRVSAVESGRFPFVDPVEDMDIL